MEMMQLFSIQMLKNPSNATAWVTLWEIPTNEVLEAAWDDINPYFPPQPSTILTFSRKWHGLSLSKTSLNNLTLPKSAKKINNSIEIIIQRKFFLKIPNKMYSMNK